MADTTIKVKADVSALEKLTDKLEATKKLQTWPNWLGGKRLTAVLLGLVLPLLIVIVGAFLVKAQMAFDLAKYIGGYCLLGIIAYITGRTVHNIKELKNGGANK